MQLMFLPRFHDLRTVLKVSPLPKGIYRKSFIDPRRAYLISNLMNGMLNKDGDLLQILK